MPPLVDAISASVKGNAEGERQSPAAHRHIARIAAKAGVEHVGMRPLLSDELTGEMPSA
jgi:hypothetical protein